MFTREGGGCRVERVSERARATVRKRLWGRGFAGEGGGCAGERVRQGERKRERETKNDQKN